MPPSTDCSAATSCGGCRSYAGAVAVGRLKSSATATGVPPSPCGRARITTPGEAGVRRAPPDRTSVRSLLPPGTDSSGARRQLGRTLGSRRGRRPTPVCTPICTTCGQVGGWRRVDMWRRPGTPGGHPPSSPSSPARRRPPAVDGRKSATIFARRTTSHTGGCGDTGVACGRRRVTGQRTAVRTSAARHRTWTRQSASQARSPQRRDGAPAERREGRRTGVRRPSRAVLCAGVSRRRPRWCSGVADLGVHPHRDGVLPGRLDAAGQLDAATVELRAAGGGDRRGDVGGGDAAEQAAARRRREPARGRSGRTAARPRPAPPRASAPHGRHAPGGATRSASRHRGWPGWPARGAGGSCGRTRP